MANVNGYVQLTNVSGENIKPVTDLSAINMTTSNGIVVVPVNDGTIGIEDGYIEQTYYNNMVMQGPEVGPADPASAYIDGGTMFTLIGGYAVSDEIPPAADADPYKIPSELSVRSAIDALATLGPSLTPGAGIVVTTVPGSTGGILSVAEGNGVEVNTAQQGGVSVKAGAGISVDSDGVSVVTATNNTFGGIAGATNGVTLVNGVAQVDAGDGLLIDSGKVMIDEASVETTLQDVRIDEGSTVSPVDDQVLTPGNLRGALSVGQAVDVSCQPYNNSGSIVYVNDDFLQGFTATMVNGTTVGFYDTTTHRFPKFANGLVYLFIANVSGSGTVTPNGASAVTLSGTPQRIWTKVTAANSGYISASANATMTVTNWRQYEVTALTDEAIAYIAQLPDPDAFFRSTSAYSIRDKYLIKQDMVCPFIPTINMPDNSDLTVAAGLSYKIKYTNDNTHTITADTIPTDAYGWDTHIQMFIKGTSAINFQAPLVLMDALTPNAGHNMVVKWRNGDALVYVDDTNAGNIVISTTGSTVGTLNYYLTQNPGTGQENYIIFGAVTDGAVCDASSVSVAYNTNVIGNGTDKTTITGTYSVASGKIMNLQDLVVSGSTFGNTTGNISLYNDSLIDVDFGSGATISLSEVIIPSGSTVTRNTATSKLNGTLTLNGKVRQKTTFQVNNGSIVGSGSGIIEMYDGGIAGIAPIGIVNISNITITGGARGVFAGYHGDNITTITGCTLSGNTIAETSELNGGVSTYPAYISTVTIHNSYIADNALADITVDDRGSIDIWDSTIGIIRVRHSSWADSHASLTLNGNIVLRGTNANYLFASKFSLTLKSGLVLRWDSTVDSPVGIGVGSGYMDCEDDITLIAQDGTEGHIDGCRCSWINRNFGIYGVDNNTEDIIIQTNKNIWEASKVCFMQTIDAHEASTVKLSGTTFTSASQVLNANRIQLPASTTVSFQGNTNDANTKILDASLIVVGDNPASPSDSATVVNASGTSSTVTGIGTYIDKEGDNDFVANNATNVIPVDASTTGAKYLGTVLSATTGDTGANRFAKIDSGAVAVVNEATNAVNKQIITHDYEPILGGTFSLTSATVDEATKTVAIQSGGTMSVVDIRGGKDSVIDLGGSSTILVQLPAFFSGCVISGGSAAAGGIGTQGGGVKVVRTNTTFNNVTFKGNVASGAGFGGGLFYIGTSADSATFTSCTFTDNIAQHGAAIYFTACPNAYLSDCVFGSSQSISTDKGSVITIGGTCRTLSTITNALGTGTVILSSGAILDLTGNTNATPIAPGGDITFGANVTVINSAGSSVLLNNGEAGTCTVIKNDGTIE